MWRLGDLQPLDRSRIKLSHPCPIAAPITGAIQATMHVEPAFRRREAVKISWGRRCARLEGREFRPGHHDGVVNVEVAKEEVCASMALDSF